MRLPYVQTPPLTEPLGKDAKKEGWDIRVHKKTNRTQRGWRRRRRKSSLSTRYLRKEIYIFLEPIRKKLQESRSTIPAVLGGWSRYSAADIKGANENIRHCSMNTFQREFSCFACLKHQGSRTSEASINCFYGRARRNLKLWQIIMKILSSRRADETMSPH